MALLLSAGGAGMVGQGAIGVDVVSGVGHCEGSGFTACTLPPHI